MTIEQACRTLGKTATTLRNWRARGIGPNWHKIGGRVVYDAPSVEQYAKTGVA